MSIYASVHLTRETPIFHLSEQQVRPDGSRYRVLRVCEIPGVGDVTVFLTTEQAQALLEAIETGLGVHDMQEFNCPDCGGQFSARCGQDIPQWCPWCGVANPKGAEVAA